MRICLKKKLWGTGKLIFLNIARLWYELEGQEHWLKSGSLNSNTFLHRELFCRGQGGKWGEAPHAQAFAALCPDKNLGFSALLSNCLLIPDFFLSKDWPREKEPQFGCMCLSLCQIKAYVNKGFLNFLRTLVALLIKLVIYFGPPGCLVWFFCLFVVFVFIFGIGN